MAKPSVEAVENLPAGKSFKEASASKNETAEAVSVTAPTALDAESPKKAQGAKL